MTTFKQMVDDATGGKDLRCANAGELADFFAKLPRDTVVMVLDGFNGGGDPRFLNYGPRAVKVTQKLIKTNGDTYFLKPEDNLIVFGYGCY